MASFLWPAVYNKFLVVSFMCLPNWCYKLQSLQAAVQYYDLLYIVLAMYSNAVMLYCRFINARRRVIQPAAAADAAADNHESSAAKRMKTMLQREARSQFWSPPPHATSVSYTSQAVEEEAHSLSSTSSSTVSYATRVSMSFCLLSLCMLQDAVIGLWWWLSVFCRWPSPLLKQVSKILKCPVFLANFDSLEVKEQCLPFENERWSKNRSPHAG